MFSGPEDIQDALVAHLQTCTLLQYPQLLTEPVTSISYGHAVLDSCPEFIQAEFAPFLQEHNCTIRTITCTYHSSRNIFRIVVLPSPMDAETN